jgi:osmotically-inducible protein OsmY
MKHLLIAVFTSTLLALSGCGSMLATMEVDTIEEDEGERTWGSFIEDDNIETKARVNIHAADEAFDNAHLNIVSYNGYVLIAGQVPTETLKTKATDVVRKIRGVRRIYNELEVAAPSSGMTRTSDTWITTKVKSFLLGNPDIQGNRVKVVTEDGVVYLMGLVTRDEAKRITDQASEISGVQKVVRLFELID